MEKPIIKFFLLSFRLMAKGIFPLTGKRELSSPAVDLINEVETLIEAGEDFEKGRISGRYALTSEDIQESVFNVYKLVEGRQKARKLKGDN